METVPRPMACESSRAVGVEPTNILVEHCIEVPCNRCQGRWHFQFSHDYDNIYQPHLVHTYAAHHCIA